MYCTKCGAQNPDGANFCQNCGGQLITTTSPTPTPTTTSIPTPQPTPVSPVAQVPPAAQVARKTSGMAVAALVLGIIGFFAGFPAILAIIFGGIALNQTGKDPTLGGHGLAIAGLVLGIIGVAFWAIIALFVAIGSVAATTIY
jgi:hypothetical protein